MWWAITVGSINLLPILQHYSPHATVGCIDYFLAKCVSELGRWCLWVTLLIWCACRSTLPGRSVVAWWLKEYSCSVFWWWLPCPWQISSWLLMLWRRRISATCRPWYKRPRSVATSPEWRCQSSTLARCWSKSATAWRMWQAGVRWAPTRCCHSARQQKHSPPLC